MRSGRGALEDELKACTKRIEQLKQEVDAQRAIIRDQEEQIQAHDEYLEEFIFIISMSLSLHLFPTRPCSR